MWFFNPQFHIFDSNNVIEIIGNTVHVRDETETGHLPHSLTSCPADIGFRE